MSLIYNTLQNVQNNAGAPLLRSVVPPVLSGGHGAAAQTTPLYFWSLAGILTGVLVGLLLVG